MEIAARRDRSYINHKMTTQFMKLGIKANYIMQDFRCQILQ
jgi:hypothetical protein